VVEDRTYLCRCEDLTKEKLHEILDKYDDISMEEIKRITRATMGPCQGRTCKELIAREIAKYRDENLEKVGLPSYRAPITPTKLGEIARSEENDG